MSESPTPRRPRLGVRGWLRWVWRQLTSMRVALMLLLALAIAALPGSVLPQRPQDPGEVVRYLEENPTWGEILDRLGFFDVFSSVWFSAIYLLLFVSLIGCILPRTKVHLKALRTQPPKPPRRFDRFRARQKFEVAAQPQEVANAANRILGRKYRSYVVEEKSAWAVAGERGYLRETGNLLFHLALLGVLVAMAASHLLTYRGQALVLEGRGFANSVVDYDTFEAGPWVDTEELSPFSFVLERFESEFTADAEARNFEATVSVTDPDGAVETQSIRVNHPMNLGGTKVFLSGNGYAPNVTVRNAEGEVAFSGSVPFLPQDEVYTSPGVIKVPDMGGEEQIGLAGSFLPTAEVRAEGARSIHPQPHAPLLVLTLWAGDLGLDSGIPQNVYELDARNMVQISQDGEPMETGAVPSTITAELGEVVEMPGGYGSIEFNGVDRFVALDVRHDPAIFWVLITSLAAFLGLIGSLFTPRRRVWLRATRSDDGRTLVEVAGLTRHEDMGLEPEITQVITELKAQLSQNRDGDEK
ncbi:MAG TPA: cytochrome c biogenesis protein ResB [Actinomycetales bacterium]|nr:cytochrome c biogenesis protein ResB [Actinomycetales bacterium]